MSEPRDNMRIWNEALPKTDRTYTRHVNQRGGFTAIDAYYKIREATRYFGPVGQGWGWETEEFFESGTVIVKVQLWYVEKDRTKVNTVIAYGQKRLEDKRGPDEDAAKKALTDGITKALSYLGFCNDVFMGEFDSKYVEPQSAPSVESLAWKPSPADVDKRVADLASEQRESKANMNMWELVAQLRHKFEGATHPNHINAIVAKYKNELAEIRKWNASEADELADYVAELEAKMYGEAARLERLGTEE